MSNVRLDKTEAVRDEITTISSWMEHLLGDEWYNKGGAIGKLKSYLDSRHPLVDAQVIGSLINEHVCSRGRFRITDHAIRRFRQRTGSKKPDSHVRRKMTDMLLKAEPVELVPKYRVRHIINHGFEEAEYYNNSGWIFVVVDGVVKTVHQGQAGRWQPISK